MIHLGKDVKLNVCPILVTLHHDYVFEGPCRMGKDFELTKEFDKDGIVLSQGETQKLGLSRLLYGYFGLLILDEPSSSLDPIAEYELTKMIFNQSNKAKYLFMHLFYTPDTTTNEYTLPEEESKHCVKVLRLEIGDEIFLVDNGVIKEHGTHDELMAKKGKYYDMFTKQAENYVK